MTARISRLEEALALSHAATATLAPNPLLNGCTPESGFDTSSATTEKIYADREVNEIEGNEEITFHLDVIYHRFAKLGMSSGNLAAAKNEDEEVSRLEKSMH